MARKKTIEELKATASKYEQKATIAEKGKLFDGTDRDMGDITAWSKDKYNLIQTDI